MNAWVLKDGTEVSLGGAVTGDSPLAEYLRGAMRGARQGVVSSGYGAHPHIEKLDPGVPHLLDYYLRADFEVVSGPGVEYPAAQPRPAPPEGCEY